MAKIEVKHPFPGKSTSECYKACLALVDKAGYKLFKKRDIANLVICNGSVEGYPVDLSLMVPFGNPATVVVSLASEKSNETILRAEMGRLINLLVSSF